MMDDNKLSNLIRELITKSKDERERMLRNYREYTGDVEIFNREFS